MTWGTGAQSKVVIGVEATFKTAATAGFVMPVNSCALKPNRSKQSAKTITGNMNPVAPFNGNLSITGDVTVPVDSAAFWYWLQLAMGDPATTGSDPYAHAFTLGTARPSFTLEEQFLDIDTPQYFLYTGCKISSMRIEGGGDGELTATFGITGAAYSINTSSFDASPTALSLTRLNNDDLALTEGGGSISNAMSVSLDVNFNLDTSGYCVGGGGELGALPDGIYEVRGSLKALFEDVSLITKAINSTESALVATFTGGASSILAINLPEIQYEENPPGIDGPQGVIVDLPFVAYFDDATESTSLQITLTNGDEHA